MKKGGVQKVETDKGTRRVVWLLVTTMALSFAFGVGYFLSDEYRAAKLDETMAKYQARRKTP